jgi:hypothetical protein
MTEGITDLSVLHEVPYRHIEGAYVKVNQEIENDPLMMEHKTVNRTHTETREGTIVGRGNGQGLAYDTGEKRSKPISIGPSIYLDTPGDTILEVRTDKVENELLEFEPPEDTDE